MSYIREIYVILPTYNNEKTIERAIRSVLEQDYTGHMHLIVVANACTDNTPKIVYNLLEEYYNENNSFRKNIKFSYIRTEKKGVVVAFNKGLEFATQLVNVYESSSPIFTEYTWICRMDGDDAWYPDKIRKQVEFIEANPEVDVVGAQMRYVTPDEYKPIGQTHNPVGHNEIFNAMMQGSNVVANPVAMCKWEVMDKAGRLEDIFPYAEDYWFWLKVLLTGHKFANMPDVLMDYTYEHKPHENPAVGQSVAQVAQFIFGYNQAFRKK